MLRRTLGAAVTPLGEREVQVVISTGALARDGHILEPDGCQLDNYRRNPIVLWQHDSRFPIGRADKIEVYGDRIAARISFAAPGISQTADEACGLVKSGIVSTVSVGFDVIEAEPLDPRLGTRGGLRISQWELLECSFVSIPADPGAVVTSRFRGNAVMAEQQALMEKLGDQIDSAESHLDDAGRAHARGDKRAVEAAHRRCQRALDKAREAHRDLGALGAQSDFDNTQTIQTSAGIGIDNGSSAPDRGYLQRQAEKLRLAPAASRMLRLPPYSGAGGAAGWVQRVRLFEEQQRLAHCGQIDVGHVSTRAERMREVERLRLHQANRLRQ